MQAYLEREDRHEVLASRLVAAKHVQVGGVHLGLAADERGFAVAGSVHETV